MPTAFIATKDGGILAAQTTNSAVMKIDKRQSFNPLQGHETGGAVSMNKRARCLS